MFRLISPLILLWFATTASAQVDPTLNPLFRPKGAIVNKGSARYYVWYEGSTWHIRSTAAKLQRFHGSVTVTDGKVDSYRLIGREQNQDIVRRSADRKTLTFSFQTANASDGIDIKIRGEDHAKVSFRLGFGKKKLIPVGAVLVGAKQQTPKRWPMVFPAKPNRTMYAQSGIATVNPPKPKVSLPADPILLLTFDAKSFGLKNGKQVVWDYSSKQNVGTLYKATPAEGKVDGGLTFEPEASAIMTDISQRDAQTIAMWVKLNEIGPFRSIVSGGGNKKGFSINLKNNGKVNLTYGTGQTYLGVGGAHGLAVGQWTHVAAVVDSNAKKFSYYVNGVHRHTGTIQKPIAGLDECKLVLSVNWKGHALHGAIDEVAVYGRPLSAKEIAALHAAGQAGVSLASRQ